MRLLKIYSQFCSPAGAKYPFFLGSSSWTITFTLNFDVVYGVMLTFSLRFSKLDNVIVTEQKYFPATQKITFRSL